MRGHSYNPTAGRWQENTSEASLKAGRFTCLTWNVWFGDYGFGERAEGLLRTLEDCRADLLALQEVTPALLERLTRCAMVQREYTVSAIDPQAMEPYGLLLMTRWNARSFRRLPLPSGMNRYALIAELDTPHGVAAVANVHLESMSFQEPVREQQLRTLFEELEPYALAMVLGDFNLCSSWTSENDQLDPRYTDLWPQLCGDDPGYTEDTVINSMRLAQRRESKQVRFDRILLRDDFAALALDSMVMLGRSPLGPELFVSDHFGLLAGLVVRPHDPDRLLMLGRDSRDYGKRSPWGDSVAKLPIEQLEELEKVERFWGKGGSYLEARGDHDTIRIGRCGLTKPAKPISCGERRRDSGDAPTSPQRVPQESLPSSIPGCPITDDRATMNEPAPPTRSLSRYPTRLARRFAYE